jgi:simple sugar transport system permease protein
MTGTAEDEASSEAIAGGQPAVQEIAAAPASAGARVLDLISRRREASIAFVTVVLFVYFSLQHEAFFTNANLRVVAQFAAPIAILAIAQVMNLVGGEIDLSLGHIYAFAPFIMVSAQDWGLPLPLALVFAVIVASVVGLTNGLITVTTGVPSFITTLGMFFFLNGVTLSISDGFPKTPTRGGFAEWIGGAALATFWWAVGFTVVLHIVLTNTRWGVYTIATGGNPVGASEAGIQVKRMKIGNFMLAAALAGFAGISEGTLRRTFLPLAGGTNLMFFGVAAAVIGGTALFGGSGTIIGAFLGAFLISVLRDGLTLNGISANTYNIILGAAIIASMVLNAVANRVRLRLRKT